MRSKYFQYIFLVSSFFLALTGCVKNKDYETPVPKNEMQNDCIKRTLGPNMVGQNIEFAYAMALPAAKGKIVSAWVEASIAGAPETYLENKSYYTNGSNGQDTGIPIGDPAVNKDALTTVNFTKDTNAATLRYFYRIPEAARGQTVKFTFTAKSSNGETVTYAMGPYTISKMDMKLDLRVKDGDSCYISLAGMKVYNAAGAAANADKIDLVYLYRAMPAVTFAHALVSPGSNPEYLPDITLPANVNRRTKISKVWDLRDFNLARLQYGIYIDDVDFVQRDLSAAPDFAINMKKEAGAWVETADGKYRGYIFINLTDDKNKLAVISIKRYTMK